MGSKHLQHTTISHEENMFLGCGLSSGVVHQFSGGWLRTTVDQGNLAPPAAMKLRTAMRRISRTHVFLSKGRLGTLGICRDDKVTMGVHFGIL